MDGAIVALWVVAHFHDHPRVPRIDQHCRPSGDGVGDGCVLMIDASSRVYSKTKRPFGAHVSLAPNSGVRADIPGPPLWANIGSGC
jgi:hypothetical protein